MVTYLITPKHVYTPQTEVYFCYDLLDAFDMADDLEKKTEHEWMIAEVLDGKHWFTKLITWLARKVR